MKKLIPFILSVLLIFSLTSCASSPDNTTDTPELVEVYEMITDKGYSEQQVKEKLAGRYYEDIYVSWGDSYSVINGLWADIWLLDESSGKCIALYYNTDGYVHDIIIADAYTDINSIKKVEGILDIVNYTPPQEYADNDHFIKEKYVDVNSLPVLDMDIQKQYSIDGRTFAIEDSVDNEIENLLYKFFLCEIQQNYTERQLLVGDEQNFAMAVNNEAEIAQDGIFISERIIHSMEILPVETVSTVSASDRNSILEVISAVDIAEYAVVKLDTTWRHNPEIDFAPQVSDGRYNRYYLVARQQGIESWKIYNVFWYFEE